MTTVTNTSPHRGLVYLGLICFVATLGGLLFGYDTAVIAGAIGFLQQRFALTPMQEGWAAACALFGCAVGAALAGPLSDGARWKEVLGLWLAAIVACFLAWKIPLDRLTSNPASWLFWIGAVWIGITAFLSLSALGSTLALFVHGRKKVLILAAVLFFVSAVGTALPTEVGHLYHRLLDALLGHPDPRKLAAWLPGEFTWFVGFRIVGGVAIGAASLISPMYIAEISPARIRGRMVSLNQLAIVFGMLAVYFVNYFIAGLGDQTWNVQYGWRWMFGSGTLPSLALLVLLFFVPESPRWLTKQGRREAALAVLTRVNGPQQAQLEIAAIEDAIARETGSLAQLIQPGMRVVVVIGVALAVLQQITGINAFLYFAPEIFKSIAGAESDVALLQTVVVGAVNMLFTVVAIWTVDHLGRKPLMLIGFAGMGVCLLFLGLAAYLERTDVWVLVFMLGYIASFALSVGPVTWVILSEIFPTGIRGRAMGLATVCLWAANLVISQTFPMLDKNELLLTHFHHAAPFWLYGVFCVIAIVFVAALVPETKGRTLEEIEQWWLKR